MASNNNCHGKKTPGPNNQAYYTRGFIHAGKRQAYATKMAITQNGYYRFKNGCVPK